MAGKFVSTAATLFFPRIGPFGVPVRGASKRDLRLLKVAVSFKRGGYRRGCAPCDGLRFGGKNSDALSVYVPSIIIPSSARSGALVPTFSPARSRSVDSSNLPDGSDIRARS